jgi:hypothetical protein
MNSDKSGDQKQPHAITVRAWPLEISGQGLGIIGVLAVVALVLFFFKPDITRALQHSRQPTAADARH